MTTYLKMSFLESDMKSLYLILLVITILMVESLSRLGPHCLLVMASIWGSEGWGFADTSSGNL